MINNIFYNFIAMFRTSTKKNIRTKRSYFQNVCHRGIHLYHFKETNRFSLLTYK